MTYDGVLLLLLGLVCFINLLLLVGLVRRLRMHIADHEKHVGAGARPYTLSVGALIPEFTASAVGGSTFSSGELQGSPSLIGFFSAACRGCRAQVPDFCDLARTIPNGPDHVLAVIDGASDDGRDLEIALAEVATVVAEPEGGPVVRAFEVHAFPTFYVIDARGHVYAGSTKVPRVDISLVASAVGT
jgi:peroxiredoxin